MQTLRAFFTRLPRAMQRYEYHLTVLWLVLQLLPCAWTQPAKVLQCSPPSDTTRQLCQHFGASSCDFYTHCIDSLSSCGPQGFAQSYAQPRCENVRQLNASRNSPLVQWAASQDQCLKGRLYGMISSGSNQLSCLQLESAAFEQLEACYNSSKQQLCAALKATDSKAFLRDIPPLLQAIGGSEYYVGLAVRQLEKAIISCNTSLPINEVFPQTTVQHATYCITVTERENLSLTTPDLFIDVLKSKLGSYGGTWKYFGVDWNWRCVLMNPILAQPVAGSNSEHFHFVVWQPNATSMVVPVIPNGLGYFQYSRTATFLYLAFSVQYSNTTCGDGLLQAGELCDLAAYNGAYPSSSPSDQVYANMSGCSTQCTNATDFECYAEPLQRSICAKVTCGDGLKASTEACDDGNTMEGDGCSRSCTIEVGYRCRIAGLLSLCKQESLPPSNNFTTASPTPYRPGTLHPFAATLVASSPLPSSDRSISMLSALHILLLFLIVMSWAR